MATSPIPDNANHWLSLTGRTASVGVDHDLTLNAYVGETGELAWQSSAATKPTAHVLVDGADQTVAVSFGGADERRVEDYSDKAGRRGKRARLSGWADVDVQIEVVYAIDDEGELLVQIEQVGGADVVQRVSGLYDWQLTPAADAYMLVPRGSGYLIRADQPGEAEVAGMFGSNHSMPLFGIVRGEQSQFQIVDTWWDAHLSVKHTPGQGIDLSLDWEASLGKLTYARRLLIRFGKNIDHVGMARGYRNYLIERGEFKTLKERAETLPALEKYLGGVEYRWPHWPETEQQIEHLRTNITEFQNAGVPISFFYPKWPCKGLSGDDRPSSYDAGWQGYIHPDPMPGGWAKAAKLLSIVHELGCTAKVMLTPHIFKDDAPGWDPQKSSGISAMPHLSDNYAQWMINEVHDAIEKNGFNIDAMYFDGSAAYAGHNEHQGRSRREGFEAQVAQFDETRRRGIIPGAELARAWAIPACDYFFFTDWSSDRLRNGEPVPVMPLIFHDCYGAHFSGGGYYNEGTYDWYEDRHPRLYELMYAAVPSHNWLPGGSREIALDDWGTDKMKSRLSWLRKWHRYYMAIRYSQMTNHQFLNDERTLQRIEYANGAAAEFDLDKGMFRIEGIEGFSGEWETPDVVER